MCYNFSMYSVWYYTVIFTLYSMIGWLIDTLYTRVYEGRWAKRGFHHGPFYMLYGWGALVSVLLFTEQTLPLVVIPIAILYSCLIEYGGSVLFERVGLSYWDYSKNILNLNGRICLQSISIFVCGIVAVIYWLHPLLRQWLAGLPSLLITSVGALAFGYLIVWGAVRMVFQYRYFKHTPGIRNQAYDIAE